VVRAVVVKAAVKVDLAASLAVNHAANLAESLAENPLVSRIAASTVTRAQHALVRQCEK
jgi:hypothetical protein